jgi:retron-type reverse transcriptase
MLTLVGCGYKYDNEELCVTAKVLSVNQNILRGNLIGGFLSSPNGAIANDINIVGVSYMIGEELFLEDLELKHAMLSYYADKNELPLILMFEKRSGVGYWMRTRLNGYIVHSHLYTKETINSIMDEELQNDKN